MGSSKYTSHSFRPFGSSTADDPKPGEVSEYKMLDWSKENRPTYSQIKETFVKDVKKKDQRFFLSELVAGQLSVEEEDQRRFELRLEEELALKVAAIKDSAYQDGYAKGLEAGVEKAFAEERARIAAQLEAFALVTNDLSDSKLKLAADYEKQLTDYVFQIAETVVESEIAHRPESVTVVIKNVLDLLSKEEDVKIYVSMPNKIHLAAIKAELSKLTRTGACVIDFKDSLGAGDCIVEAMSGEVSAKVSERIAAFRQEIMEHFNQTPTKKAV